MKLFRRRKRGSEPVANAPGMRSPKRALGDVDLPAGPPRSFDDMRADLLHAYQLGATEAPSYDEDSFRDPACIPLRCRAFLEDTKCRVEESYVAEADDRNLAITLVERSRHDVERLGRELRDAQDRRSHLVREIEDVRAQIASNSDRLGGRSVKKVVPLVIHDGSVLQKKGSGAGS